MQKLKKELEKGSISPTKSQKSPEEPLEEPKNYLNLFDWTNDEKSLLRLNLKFKAVNFLVFFVLTAINLDNHDYRRNSAFQFLNIDVSGAFAPSLKQNVTLFMLNFAKWDGIFFLKNILWGEDNIKQHAFFPGMPFIVKTLSSTFEAIIGLFGISMDIYFRIILIIGTGITLNFLLNILNNVMIYR